MKRSSVKIPRKVLRLETLAEEHGWSVKIARADLFKGTREVELQAAHLIAMRNLEMITMTWVDGVAMGPIGWHITGGLAMPLEDRADAERIISSPRNEDAQPAPQ